MGRCSLFDFFLQRVYNLVKIAIFGCENFLFVMGLLVNRFLAGTEKSPIFHCWCPGRVVCGNFDDENPTKWILDIMCEEKIGY